MSIRERILSRPDLAALRASRDLDKLAEALNGEELRAPGSRYVTTRTIMAECTSGKDIVRAIRAAASADAVVDEALHFLRDDSGFDVGHPNTQAIVSQLVAAGVFDPAWEIELREMAMQLVTVTRDQVNEAMFNPDGSEK